MIAAIITISLLPVLVFLIYASANIRSGFYLKTLSRLNTTEKTLALTFDDGPDPLLTPLILDVLAKHNIKALFFCIGKKIKGHEHILQRMANEGHVLGVHSYSHANSFPIFSAIKMKADLEACASEIVRASGVEAKLFRPPFGVTNPTIAKVVRRLGYTTIGWNIRSLDTSLTPERAVSRTIAKLSPGAIILFHDTTEEIIAILEKVIHQSENDGYRFVRADEYL